MIRLAVNGDEALWRAVASRLHGASIAGCFGAGGNFLTADSHDAVFFVDSAPVDISVIERTLAHGKHVLIAAGPWLTVERLGLLTTAASQAKVHIEIVNPDHFLPSRQLIRQQLDAGKLGEPGLIRIHRWEATAENVSKESKTLPSPLVCDLELATWLTGSLPNSIYATQTTPPAESARLGRIIQVHLGFPNGAMALIDYSNALPSGDGYQSLSVIGSAGAVYADDHQNVQLVFRGDHPQAVRTGEGIRLWVQLTQEFVDAVKDDRDLSTTATQWHQALAVMQAVEQSLESRQSIAMEGLQS